MKAAAYLGWAALGCALWGCLERPLGRADEAYDARAALRGDSLSGFDSVDVFLVDAEDDRVVARIWRGPLASAEDLGAGVAPDGGNLVYVVIGYRRDRGACFQFRKAAGDSARVLVDTCRPAAGVPGPKGPGGDPGPVDPDPVDPDGGNPEPPPRFAADALDLNDSVPGIVRVLGLGLRPAVIRAEPDWLEAAWEASGNADTSEPGRDSVLAVRARIGKLEAGGHAGRIILEAGGASVDTLPVALEVAQRYVRGRAEDWISGEPQAGVRVDLEMGPFAITGSDGSFAIPVPAGPARFPARFTAPGRLGALDTLALAPDGDYGKPVPLPTAAGFRPVDLPMRPKGAVAACAGYGIALSTPYDGPGEAYLIRLDGPRPILDRVLILGNDGGASDPGSHFEAGALAADSGALYIAYPEAGRIGRIGNWRGEPERLLVSVPFGPGGLLLDGDRLLALGRLEDGTLALARFRAADLALQKVDTLAGQAWDGVLPLQRWPALAAGPGGYYAVDGNDPNRPGRVLRLDRETGAVTAQAQFAEGGLQDIVRIGDRIYAGGAGPDARRLPGFGAGLGIVDTVDAGGPITRFASAVGAFAGYGFAAAGSAVLAFAPGAKEPLGRIPLPTTAAALWIAADGATRTVLVSDREKIHAAAFRPD